MIFGFDLWFILHDLWFILHDLWFILLDLVAAYSTSYSAHISSNKGAKSSGSPIFASLPSAQGLKLATMMPRSPQSTGRPACVTWPAGASQNQCSRPRPRHTETLSLLYSLHSVNNHRQRETGQRRPQKTSACPGGGSSTIVGVRCLEASRHACEPASPHSAGDQNPVPPLLIRAQA